MTPVLSFTVGEMGRETVQLGDIAIGEVAPFNGVRTRATYALWLPDLRHHFVPAESITVARRRVRELVNDWLLRSGVFYPGQDVEAELRRNGDACKLADVE